MLIPRYDIFIYAYDAVTWLYAVAKADYFIILRFSPAVVADAATRRQRYYCAAAALVLLLLIFAADTPCR